MTTNLPTTTSEITADWMTEALRGSGTIGADVRVSAVDADPANAGVGFMGEVSTIGVQYEPAAPDAPSKVVAKFATQSPDVKTMMHPTRVYEREHRFYERLAAHTPVRTPEVYHVTCETSEEPLGEQYMLLLEDLGGLVLGDQVAGVSAEQAESALVGLAKHHAHFWNGAGLDDAPFVPPINGVLNKAGQGIYEASLPGFKEVFSSALQPEMVPIAEAYGNNHPLLLDKLADMPNTLVHFDYRADNLFFEPPGSAAEGDVVVIDWQSISVGGGAADVGYFLGQNLSPADRREHEDALLHRYHDTLTAAGVTGYDFDTFFDDYRLGLVYGWVIPVFAVGSLDSSSERAMSLWTNVIERVQDAIFQHNAQEFIQ